MYFVCVPCKSVTRYGKIVHVLRLCTIQKCNALQKDCTCTSFTYNFLSKMAVTECSLWSRDDRIVIYYPLCTILSDIMQL